MTFKKNTPGCNGTSSCGCDSCTWASSSFDEPDTTTVSGWAEDAGDWEVVDGKLSIATTGARIKCNVTLSASGSPVVSAILDGTGKARVMFNYVVAGGNLTASCVEFDTAAGKVRNIDILAGVETTDKECDATFNGDDEILACFEGNSLSGWVNGDLITSAYAPTPATSSVIALGTGDTVSTAITFDDVLFRKNKTRQTGCEDCDSCCWPVRLLDDRPLHMTVVVTGGTSGWNGTYTLDLH